MAQNHIKINGIDDTTAEVLKTPPTDDTAGLAVRMVGNITAVVTNPDGYGLTDDQLRASPVPVSISSISLPAGAATSENQTTLGNQTTKINDGTNTATIKAASTAALTTDTAIVVAISPNNTIPISAASLPLPTNASQEHTAAASPSSTRLSDGAAFYDATKTGQLPSALVGGRLDSNIGTWFGSTAPTVGQKIAAASIPVVLASDISLPVTVAQNTAYSPVYVAFNRMAYDAFGRNRISEPHTLFDSKQLVDKQPLVWDDQLVSGSGGASTYNTNQASTTLSVANATAARRVRQTFQRFNYQPGKSQEWMMTGILGTPATGITCRIGLFDDNNGVFFESSPTTVNVVTRTFTSGATVDSAIPQSSWNIDKLDGYGTSGITADWSKTQIFGCFFEWLGVGTRWFFVVVNGENILIHQAHTSNIDTLVYMSTPNLPLRYEIINSGTGGAASLLHICSTVISEGGRDVLGSTRSLNHGATPLITNNNSLFYPIFALRLGSSYFGAAIELNDLSIISTSNCTFNWMLILNPTVTGTAFTFSAVTNSVIEADVTRTNTTTVSGGTTLAGGTLQQTNEGGPIVFSLNDFRMGASIAGVADVLVIAVQRITGTTESFIGTINWKELI